MKLTREFVERKMNKIVADTKFAVEFYARQDIGEYYIKSLTTTAYKEAYIALKMLTETAEYCWNYTGNTDLLKKLNDYIKIAKERSWKL